MQETISAVHDSEVESFFRSLGVYGDLIQGRLKCRICGATITPSNFRAVTKRSGNLLFSCNQEECFHEFASLVPEGQ